MFAANGSASPELMSTGSSARIWATLSGFPARRVSSIRFTNNSALGGTRELPRVLDGVATRHYRAHGVPEKEQWHARMRFLGKCDDGSKVTYRLRPAILGCEELELRHVGGGPAVSAMIGRVHHESPPHLGSG